MGDDLQSELADSRALAALAEAHSERVLAAAESRFARERAEASAVASAGEHGMRGALRRADALLGGAQQEAAREAEAEAERLQEISQVATATRLCATHALRMPARTQRC